MRVKFTSDFLNKLTTDKPSEYHTDTETDNLTVLVMNSGTVTFYHYKKVNGVPRRKKIGRWPAMTIEVARRLARKMTSDYDTWAAGGFKGADPTAKEKKPDAGVTVGELFEDYIRVHIQAKQRNAAAAEATRRYLYSCGISALKDREINSLNEMDAQKIFSDLNAAGKPALANRTVECFRTILRFAAKFPTKYHYAAGDITSAVKLNANRERKEYITDELKANFLTALADIAGTDLGDLIRLSLLTGVRKSDLFSARWQDIKWTRKVWTLPHPKSSDPNFTYDALLVPEAIEILQRRRDSCADETWIFPNPNSESGHVSREVWWMWNEFRTAAKLPKDFPWHALRHTCASWLAEKGVPLQVISSVLGHSKIATTQRYAHLSPQAAHTALSDVMSTAFIVDQPKPRIVRRRNSAQANVSTR